MAASSMKALEAEKAELRLRDAAPDMLEVLRLVHLYQDRLPPHVSNVVRLSIFKATRR